MNLLTRQDTRPSIHSWWSDSNPGLRGPTINLHAVAKPLMRRMYHRQVSEFIRKNRDSPLSRDVLETYSSYLPWDYVSRGTKIAILSELTYRTETDVEARAVVDSPVLNHIAQMLWSPDIETRSASCALLENLALHECTAPAILDLCEQLVSLVGEEDSKLTQAAQGTLCHIAQGDGAQAIVASPVLDHVLELLQSPRWAVRGRACDLVEKLAQHDSTLLAILKSKACVLLASLLVPVDEHPEVVRSAWKTLSCIAQMLDDAPAIASKALDHVLALLESSNAEVRRWGCDRVGGLARHKSALPVILGSRACLRVVSLLDDEDPEVIRSAWNASSCIAEVLDHAPAITSKALKHILALLKSSNPDVRRWACVRVGWLAYHKSIPPAVLESKTFARLFSLLHDEHPEVVQSVIKALSQIAKRSDGAQAIVEAKVLDNVPKLIKSSHSEVRQQTCRLIEALVHHESILLAVLESKAFAQLFSLLHNEDSEAVQSTIKALSQIAERLEGAQAIVEAKVLDNVSELIESSWSSVRDGACNLIVMLVHHESILPAVLETKICGRLVAVFLRETATSTSPFYALRALHEISEWPVGAAALADIPDISVGLEELCQSPDYWYVSLVLDNLDRARSKQQIP